MVHKGEFHLSSLSFHQLAFLRVLSGHTPDFASSTGQSFPCLVISGNWRVKLPYSRQPRGRSQVLLYSAVSWLASLLIFPVCGQAQLYMCMKREDGVGDDLICLNSHWNLEEKCSLCLCATILAVTVGQLITFPLLYKIKRFGELCDRAPSAQAWYGKHHCSALGCRQPTCRGRAARSTGQAARGPLSHPEPLVCTPWVSREDWLLWGVLQRQGHWGRLEAQSCKWWGKRLARGIGGKKRVLATHKSKLRAILQAQAISVVWKKNPKPLSPWFSPWHFHLATEDKVPSDEVIVLIYMAPWMG